MELFGKLDMPSKEHIEDNNGCKMPLVHHEVYQ